MEKSVSCTHTHTINPAWCTDGCWFSLANKELLLVLHWGRRRPASISLALPTKGKDIVFRFIIEYSSLRNFGPQVIIIIGLFLYEDFFFER
jgi:hypothetical protein